MEGTTETRPADPTKGGYPEIGPGENILVVATHKDHPADQPCEIRVYHKGPDALRTTLEAIQNRIGQLEEDPFAAMLRQLGITPPEDGPDLSPPAAPPLATGPLFPFPLAPEV